MMQREDLITAAATTTVKQLFEIVKQDARSLRASGLKPAEVASYAATIGAEMAFRVIGLALLCAKHDSREALVDEAIDLVTGTIRSRRDELLTRTAAATGRSGA